jgi:hypothetical protein
LYRECFEKGKRKYILDPFLFITEQYYHAFSSFCFQIKTVLPDAGEEKLLQGEGR